MIAGGNEHLVVHFRRVVLGTSHEIFAFLAVEEHAVGLAHAPLVPFQADLLLDRHEAIGAIGLHLGRDVVFGVVGAGIFFVGVLEYAQPLEAHVAYEITELLEFRFGLAGVADEHRGANADLRHPAADFRDQLPGLGLGDLAAHAVQDGVGGVLQRHIQVVANLFALGHHVEDLQRKLAGIGVVEADPLDTVHVGQGVEQLR